MTYIQAALEGDAWFIPDVIGVYRLHGVNHSQGLKNHKADSARHYSIAGENIRRWRLVRGKLLTLNGRIPPLRSLQAHQIRSRRLARSPAKAVLRYHVILLQFFLT